VAQEKEKQQSGIHDKGNQMIQTCNSPSCRGEGPPDGPDDEPSDEFINEWIDNHRDAVVDCCIEKIYAAWESHCESEKEEAAISHADAMADIEKDRRHDY
jgi:hypothetical protein